MEMLPEVEAALRQSRWFPGRRVDEAQVIQWLQTGVRDFGCHIFPEAVRVLREFGGLTFTDIHFSPEEHLTRGDHLQWAFWEWRSKEVLFPIGYVLGGDFGFALSATGKVFGSGTSEIFCGDSFEEFLSHLLLFRSGRINWIEIVHIDWTPEMDADLEHIHNAVYGNKP